MAVNEVSCKAAHVRILLDTGSQRTYIPSRLKSRLNLSPVKSETLHLNTFGDERYTKQQCDVVIINVKRTTVTYNIDNHLYQQGLELADMSIAETGQKDIDVLIGFDYYFDIVSRDFIRGSSSLIAVSSMFGWTFAGPKSAVESREKFATTHLITERPELLTLSPSDFHDENDELCNNALQEFWDIESLGFVGSHLSQSSWRACISMRMKEDTKLVCHGRKVLLLVASSFKKWQVVCSLSQHAGLLQQQQGYLFQMDVVNSNQDFTESTR